MDRGDNPRGGPGPSITGAFLLGQMFGAGVNLQVLARRPAKVQQAAAPGGDVGAKWEALNSGAAA